MYAFHMTKILTMRNVYASSWWSWPLIYQPMSVAFVMLNPVVKLSQSVGLLGNPLIWWGGTLASLMLFLRQLKNGCKDYKAGFIILIIAVQYLPYMFFKRISYIYYFYSVLPLVILALVYFIGLMDLNKRYNQWALFLFTCLSLWLLVIFLPALMAFNINRDYVFHYLLWFKRWSF